MAKKQGQDAQLLTIHELAVYLHLDELTVNKLVAAGKIPSIQLDRQWRFKKAAIDEWIEQQLVGDEESFVDVPDGMKLPLEDLLPDQAIITNMRATTPIAVIEELAARAYTNGWLADKPWFVGAVVERESLASTAMDGGVAFLHTRAKDKGKIARPFMIVGRSWEGISFGAIDGNPTYLFFLLGLKHDRLHLPLLGRLARIMAKNPQAAGRLRAATSSQKMRATLLQLDADEMQARKKVAGDATPGESPLRPRMASARPALDREVRLRAIRRLTVERQERDAATTPRKRGEGGKKKRTGGSNRKGVK